MNNATAAPSPTFPETMPIWNAHVVRTCVEWPAGRAGMRARAAAFTWYNLDT